MKCHYEILDVPRDADLPEIKTAYKKAALKWHPDKNLNNTENAKEIFQLVQQAYEVLSDPQERAWYDKHREQILRGANSEFQDNSLDLFQYFTSTCFKGYGDDEKSFYTIYRKVFDEIINEDMEFMEDKEEFNEIPRFGDSKSDYDEVVGPFYSYWSSYCTKKSYVWLNPYDIKDMRDRRLFKLVEKDNKKVRQKAKKERNEEVRNLVAFVRKRDKRVQEHAKMLEVKVRENRQKHEELSKKKRLERRQLNESGVQAEWSKFDNVQSELEQIEKSLAQEFGEEFSNSEDEESETFDDNLYCVACNKIFKTPKAFENHESSKKHKENVERLKQTLTDDDQDEDDDISEINDEEFEHIDEELITGQMDCSGTEEDLDGDFDTEKEQLKKQKKKNKKAKNSIIKHEDDHEDEAFEITLGAGVEEASNLEDDFSSTKRKQKKTRNKKATKNTAIVNNEEITSPKTDDTKSNKKKNKQDKDDLEDIDLSHNCVTCKSTFPSKNKLFEHLKKTGHGVYLPNKNTKVKRNAKEK